MSYAWTLPYTALGVFVFALSALLSLAGGGQRWRTAPRLAPAIFALALLYSASGVTFAAVQPLEAGGWSVWCLLATALSLALAGWSSGEALASLQSFAPEEGAASAERPASGLSGSLLRAAPRLAGVLFGVWFAMSSEVVGYSGTAAGVNDTITGVFLAAVSFLALWPALGSWRWLELPVGAWVFIAPFFIQYNEVNGQYNILPEVFHICIGLMLMGFSFLGGTAVRRGDGWPRPSRRRA
jgi:hypothetical protein